MIIAAPLLGIAPTSSGSAGAASGGPSFDGLASAYGVDPTVTNPSLPLGLTVEGAGPVAQAHLNSIGNSDGLASFPYPGDTVSGLPGTAGALFGVPIPQYPLYVTTQAGDAPKVSGLPGITMEAASYPSLAIGKTVVGTDAAGFTSIAQVSVNQDQSVTASASTTLGVNLLNLLTLSGVESSASATADSFTGAITRTSHLSIGEISIPGLAIAIPANTPSTIPIPIPIPGVPQLPPTNLPPLPIPLGGETLNVLDLGFEDGYFTVTLPISLSKPIKFAIPASLVLNAFKALGINITYETAQPNSTGIIAPALTFTYDIPALPKNNYLQGKTPVAFTLGRSIASVTLHPATASTGGFTGGTGGTGTTGGFTGGTTGGTGTTGGGILPPSGPTPTVSTDTPSNAPPSSGGGTSTPPPVSGNHVVLASRDQSQADLSGLYLVGLAIAGAVVAAASVLKVLGVRLQWGF